MANPICALLFAATSAANATVGPNGSLAVSITGGNSTELSMPVSSVQPNYFAAFSRL
jgi:hypothetical protein